MSFFKPQKPAQPQAAQKIWTPPKGGVQRGDRQMAVRMAAPSVPDHRVPAETLEKSGKVGLTNARVLERLPRGCLFKVSGGWFDLDGFWCVLKADNRPEVRRGSSKKVMKLLTNAQKRELARVRLNARRNGVR